MLGGLGPPKSCSSWGGFIFLRPQGPGCLYGVLHYSLKTKQVHYTLFTKYKINHISKTTNRKYLKIGSALVSDHFTYFGTIFFYLGRFCT